MNHLLKNTAKFAIGTCFALGAATVAASVVAGKNVGKLVAAGFQGAKKAVEEELAKVNATTSPEEEVAVPTDAEGTSAVEAEVSPAAFED